MTPFGEGSLSAFGPPAVEWQGRRGDFATDSPPAGGTPPAGLSHLWGPSDGDGGDQADLVGSLTQSAVTDGTTAASTLAVGTYMFVLPGTGVACYQSGGNLASLGGGARSMAAWVRHDGAVVGSVMAAFGYGDGNALSTIVFGRSAAGKAIVTGLGSNVVTGTTTLAADAWYHLCATFDGTTWSLYVDGLLEAAGAFATNTPASNATIGNMFGSGYHNWSGFVQQLVMANGVAWSAAEAYYLGGGGYRPYPFV